MTPATLLLAAGLALASGGDAGTSRLPDGASQARLAVPVAQPVEKLIDGRDWACSGDVCTAGYQAGPDSMPLWMERGDAASELGAFTQYRTGPDTLEPAKLAQCRLEVNAAVSGLRRTGEAPRVIRSSGYTVLQG